jgi:hypothetical protein
MSGIWMKRQVNVLKNQCVTPTPVLTRGSTYSSSYPFGCVSNVYERWVVEIKLN